jgi:hypothetical protein
MRITHAQGHEQLHAGFIFVKSDGLAAVKSDGSRGWRAVAASARDSVDVCAVGAGRRRRCRGSRRRHCRPRGCLCTSSVVRSALYRHAVAATCVPPPWLSTAAGAGATVAPHAPSGSAVGGCDATRPASPETRDARGASCGGGVGATEQRAYPAARAEAAPHLVPRLAPAPAARAEAAPVRRQQRARPAAQS